MRSRAMIALEILIPLFAGKPSHPFAPLDRRTAGARSEGPGRPSAGASRAPLTAASTLAGLRRSGDRASWRCAALLAGALSVCAETTLVMAQSAPTGRPAAVHPHAAHIAEASRRFDIPVTWITAVMGAESSGEPRAVSAMGAMGLMQVMPDTWADLRARHGLGRDPFDPHDNILAGSAHLREIWDRYGDVAAMLAAYNAGSARYDKHRPTGTPLPAETRVYVDSLAPMLRGERPSPSGSETARPLDWREAAIFVAREDGASAADPASPGRSPNDAGSPVPTTSKTPFASQPNGPFVTRNAGEDRP